MKKWNEKNTLEKVMEIFSCIAFCAWLLLGCFEKKVPNGELASNIALCIVCACEAVSFWNTKRVLSYVAIGGMVVVLTALVLLAL